MQVRLLHARTAAVSATASYPARTTHDTEQKLLKGSDTQQLLGGQHNTAVVAAVQGEA